MSAQEVTEASGYWFPDDDATQRGVAVLNALRRYRAAETAMRRRTRDSMGMGETDLLAVRYLLQAQRSGRKISPKDLSAHLGISSASTTILIDRLVKSNHVRRDPHPTDRRALVITPTTATDDEVRATLGIMHRRMMNIAEGLSTDDARTVAFFLENMREAVDEIDQH
ncbi:DNA-binding MarR family transcriptional regulator [Curtobacterium sp. PhB130]|uniref:MarR family winged helix-turn-helix transcriptional regulator n=1 Tax=unclassified Curtobacterium TaxID=257496 RepID=UPI000F4CDCEA|nr:MULTISPECIES: MarR family transcriptional regulator [unclassified Curtobacterium]ROP65265.1 DNA-binding MarR family transcriptional regulator [Curtobacterium sp. ZW137]ROS78152.1 DNA-binding MarR family transcriptional regulator [Curtobacterium sp. PhB130]TCK65529.1 DNA-binding MarR family transcriptional regulator [Curtobacterium sp. PhB136]